MTEQPGSRAARAPLREQARRTIHLLLAGQLGVAMALAGLLAMTLGADALRSALAGALVGILPSRYLAGRMLRATRGATPEESLRRIYTGEIVKIAYTAALFVIAIVLLNADFLIVVLTYAAMMAVNWASLLVLDLGEPPRGSTRTRRRGLAS